ncbi:acyl carrier protein [Anaeromicropila populeti]|uniref:Acyl carrier protein n=1 Tax=Anaeromicropila populeti TaxID=37658 RepID=A0A1I6LG00_9FIRM|nr:acyl carrier protein [Anaeromicropila populeti]SFS02353.1 acyl carrier protein [Anaeromicropila populeti]
MEIFEKIKKIINENFTIEGKLTEETNITEGLGLDSFDFVTLVTTLEEEFNIEIAEEEMYQIKTLEDAVQIIQKKL